MNSTRTRLCVCIWQSVAATMLLLLFAGCGTTTSTGTVEGTVSYRNRPVYPGKVLVRSGAGKSYSANLSQEGKFRFPNIEEGSYEVSIEPIRLGNAGSQPRGLPVADPDAATPLPNREEGVPNQYRNANINFPERYRKLGESGLQLDCSTRFPDEVVAFDLVD